MHGGRAFCPAATSMHKGNAWAEVPRLLLDASVALPEVSKRKDGMRVTSFHLEATHEELPDPEVARLQESLRTKIYEVARGGLNRRRTRPKLWATLSKQPPDGVHHPLLPFARLHCGSKSVRIGAVVRDRCASWDMGLSVLGGLLEVDLGRTCVISAFSTQGRHPATRVYPRVVHRHKSRYALRSLSLPPSLSLRRLRQAAGGWRAGRLRHDHQREKREARREARSLAVRLRGSDPPLLYPLSSLGGDGQQLLPGFSVEDQPNHPPGEPYAGPSYTILITPDDPEYGMSDT